MTSSRRLFGTRSRVPATQAWPLFINAIVRALGIAFLRSASSSRMLGDLPPSSSVTRFIVAAPSRMIDLPTPTEPVNEILATSGLRTSSAPTTSPRPITTLQSPFGSLASCTHSSHACVCNALSSLGLITVVHPAAKADASLAHRKNEFAFQGVIKPATPTGSNVTVVLPQPLVKGSSGGALSADWKTFAPASMINRQNQAAPPYSSTITAV